jgi:hypothetical protein
VGRERERGEILRLLGRVRLLTLIGPGGCGKTRLAIETLAGIEAVPDGIWFVELAGLSDGGLVAQATALAVGVPIPAQRSAQEALAAHLADRETIIVLDNCEHVIDACARLAEDLLRAGPGVRVVATSREPLHCQGEVAWRVPSLAEASRLFTERAATDPRFSPTEGDEATIEEICRRLDGMPLAIELAAARVAALSLDQIAARLGDSLDVLAAGSRTARTRQQTLRATIEWSHDLLTARSACSSGALRSSRAASRSRPPRTCAPAARSRGARSSTSWRGWSTSHWSASPDRATACSTPSASSRPSASTPPPSTTRWPCATSTGAWPWPRSTTPCPPARAARCARSRPNTTICAPA